MSHLSIIIAASGSDAALESTITSVLEHQPPGAEIFVAHDGSYQDPYDLGDEVQYIIVPGATSWMQLANAAASEATTPLLHFLIAGTEVSGDWTTPAVEAFSSHDIASVCPVLLDTAGSGRVVAAGCNWSRSGSLTLAGVSSSYRPSALARCKPTGPLHAAAFFTLDAWLEAGGYDETASMELAAVDLALRLKSLGHRTAVAAGCCIHGPASLLQSEEQAADKAYQRERIFRRHAAHGSRFTHMFRFVANAAAAPAACMRAWKEKPTSTHNSFTAAYSAPDVIPMPTAVEAGGLRRAA